VNLSWTPSPSSEIKGYKVVYTDQPNLPGYLFEKSAVLANGAKVTGLDPSKDYRFAVQGMDASGNLSPASEPWKQRSLGSLVTVMATEQSPSARFRRPSTCSSEPWPQVAARTATGTVRFRLARFRRSSTAF